MVLAKRSGPDRKPERRIGQLGRNACDFLQTLHGNVDEASPLDQEGALQGGCVIFNHWFLSFMTASGKSKLFDKDDETAGQAAECGKEFHGVLKKVVVHYLTNSATQDGKKGYFRQVDPGPAKFIVGSDGNSKQGGVDNYPAVMEQTYTATDN